MPQAPAGVPARWRWPTGPGRDAAPATARARCPWPLRRPRRRVAVDAAADVLAAVLGPMISERHRLPGRLIELGPRSGGRPEHRLDQAGRGRRRGRRPTRLDVEGDEPSSRTWSRPAPYAPWSTGSTAAAVDGGLRPRLTRPPCSPGTARRTPAPVRRHGLVTADVQAPCWRSSASAPATRSR